MTDFEIESILSKEKILNFQENWDLIKYVSSIVDTRNGRKIIIHILDIWDYVNSDARKIWLDLVERAGFYPYYIKKIDDLDDDEKSIQSSIRTSFFKSKNLEGIYFHEKQKEIEFIISKNKNVAVSAPTSFGKSLLIEEIVAKNEYSNILIIQPTLALIDETRRKLSKYHSYNLVVNTRQNTKEKNIFILTAERVLEFEKMPVINFFIIDEFYKISNRRNDSRINSLNVALLKIMDMHPQAMFLTPTVDSLSEKFIKKYDVSFFKTDYALVNTNIKEVKNQKGKPFVGHTKKEKLFQLLKKQKQPSIVYVKSPNEAYKLANEYLAWANPEGFINPNLDIFEWIDENISEKWQLKKLLKNGIGTHNGALPRHIVTSEIDLFNNGTINILFATVSLIEGVNTVAKNMFIYSQKKGNNPIDFFDFANIRGRAGRMGKYFTGNVYIFNEEIKAENFVIDVPSIDQVEVSDEILINIPDKDVCNKERIKELKSELDEEIQNIFKKNLVSINGQKAMYEYILKNYEKLDFLKWKSIPTYDELKCTLNLGYEYLSNNVYSPKLVNQKAFRALQLVKFSLKKLIVDQEKYLKNKKDKDPLNSAIYDILKFQREDAKFKIPKILAVVESIQKYVFKSNGVENYGDYTLFASKLENERIDEKLQFLVDYGVPSSAILKIKKFIPTNLESDLEITNFLKKHSKTVNEDLLTYEKNLLNKAIR